nr:MAG TPA: holin [Caudoviricetes sp.]
MQKIVADKTERHFNIKLKELIEDNKEDENQKDEATKDEKTMDEKAEEKAGE